LNDVQMLTDILGSPPSIGVVCGVVLYAYGVWRGVAGADVGLAIAICLASCFERTTIDISGVVAPKPAILLCASAALILMGWTLRSRGRVAVGALLACVSAYRSFADTWLLHDRGFALLNVVLVLLAVGAIVARESIARHCRAAAVLLILFLGIFEPLGLFGVTEFQLLVAEPSYPFLLAGLALLLSERRQETEIALAGVPAFVSGTIRTASGVYGSMGGSVLAAGRVFLIGSVLCFAVGLAISIGKFRAHRGNE
jgi:hypothetical protein